jgi:hypothetical protein
MWSKIWKALMVIGGIVGVAAQAKGRGASTAEVIAETATAVVGAAGALQMTPMGSKKPDKP